MQGVSSGCDFYRSGVPFMKRCLWVVGCFVVVTFAAREVCVSQSAGRDRSILDPFIGAWRLVTLEEDGPDGKLHKADCDGLLVYTAEGQMSVQVMYRQPQQSNESAPMQYAQGGYEASYGTYTIDSPHQFTFHVEGALVRTLVGKDLKRVFELSDHRLIVRSADPNEHWRVTWERR